MARRRITEFPRVIYGPYGTSKTIHRAEDWIDGWTAHPQRDDAPAAHHAARPVLDRVELKRRLRAAEIDFPESASGSMLWAIFKQHGLT